MALSLVARVTPGSAAEDPDADEDIAELSPRMTVEGDAAVYAGVYPQDHRAGVRADTGLTLGMESGDHTWELNTGYRRDPFALHTFNFADEEADLPDRRIVHAIDLVTIGTAWRATWPRSVRTRVHAGSTHQWAGVASERRWTANLGARAAAGARWDETGPFGRVAVAGFFNRWPNFRLADRSLDANGLRTALEVGYSAGRILDASLEWAVRRTAYLDARYDTLAPDGSVERSSESKSYLRNALTARLATRPFRRTKLSVSYAYWRNDSRNYDWAVTGRAGGAAEERLVRDYFDYHRHTLGLRGRWSSTFGLRVEGEVRYWLRPFDTYQARDGDNNWTGETRLDHHTEVEAEVAWRWLETDAGDAEVVALGSHVARRSNMRRDFSFATDYDVTRLFLGVAFRGG